MRPSRAALSRRRGTLCCWPATVTPTSSVRLAFHCARRLRVFARDILRLGTAIDLALLVRVLPRKCSASAITTQDTGDLRGDQNSGFGLSAPAKNGEPTVLWRQRGLLAWVLPVEIAEHSVEPAVLGPESAHKPHHSHG